MQAVPAPVLCGAIYSFWLARFISIAFVSGLPSVPTPVGAIAERCMALHAHTEYFGIFEVQTTFMRYVSLGHASTTFLDGQFIALAVLLDGNDTARLPYTIPLHPLYTAFVTVRLYRADFCYLLGCIALLYLGFRLLYYCL